MTRPASPTAPGLETAVAAAAVALVPRVLSRPQPTFQSLDRVQVTLGD